MAAMTLDRLSQWTPTRPFLVAIDSDGCVFDNMGIKQRECFCPAMIGVFGLQPVAGAARQCKEFADLFSRTRGANRHQTVVRILRELLPAHPDVIRLGFDVPRYPYYVAWVDDPNSRLSHAGLRWAIEAAPCDEARRQLQTALTWSRRADEMIAWIVRDIPPIPGVRPSLAAMAGRADLMVCSSTPREAIVREWSEHGLLDRVGLIGGQEAGTKVEQLRAVVGRYPPENVLMIGDAPGDRDAAAEAGALFYPIEPGREADSWRRLREQAWPRFLEGRYSGSYQAALIRQYDGILPDRPPWCVANPGNGKSGRSSACT